MSIGKALSSCSMNSARLRRRPSRSGGTFSDFIALSMFWMSSSWNCSYSSLQQDTNAELKSSRASGRYTDARLAQARSAWLGDSVSNVVLKRRSHSCQSSFVDLPLVSQAALRWMAFISSFLVPWSANAGSSAPSPKPAPELKSCGRTSPFWSLLTRSS